MHKVTAELFEGVRISFFDKNDTQYVINGRTSIAALKAVGVIND